MLNASRFLRMRVLLLVRPSPKVASIVEKRPCAHANQMYLQHWLQLVSCAYIPFVHLSSEILASRV